ncbi:hypothetical protein JHD50_11855 [Sulfurimonas sp. MAG313]|nr:hypothetical protein [Sulfurimonas sp. MAG313]MDF1881983.1 hypothetical protein [Sulfurimonas sp. MAG313]
MNKNISLLAKRIFIGLWLLVIGYIIYTLGSGFIASASLTTINIISSILFIIIGVPLLTVGSIGMTSPSKSEGLVLVSLLIYLYPIIYIIGLIGSFIHSGNATPEVAEMARNYALASIAYLAVLLITIWLIKTLYNLSSAFLDIFTSLPSIIQRKK